MALENEEPKRMDLYPTKMNLEERCHSGVYNVKGLYIKVYSELSFTPLLSEHNFGKFEEYVKSAKNEIEILKRVVKIYCGIRDAGYFHPKTQFLLLNDKNGKPTFATIMPDMINPVELSFIPNKYFAVKEKKLESMLGLEHKNRDLTNEYNYRLGKEDLKLYLIDLHIFVTIEQRREELMKAALSSLKHKD